MLPPPDLLGDPGTVDGGHPQPGVADGQPADGERLGIERESRERPGAAMPATPDRQE
jgi:hypothetical protein